MHFWVYPWISRPRKRPNHEDIKIVWPIRKLYNFILSFKIVSTHCYFNNNDISNNLKLAKPVSGTPGGSPPKISGLGSSFVSL